MYKIISSSEFMDSFSEQYKNNFSYEGKQALYDYLINLEEETGTEIELDPIALCCEYVEYENLKDLQKDYTNIQTIEELQDNTQFIPILNIDGTLSERFIIASY